LGPGSRRGQAEYDRVWVQMVGEQKEKQMRRKSEADGNGKMGWEGMV